MKSELKRNANRATEFSQAGHAKKTSYAAFLSLAKTGSGVGAGKKWRKSRSGAREET